MKVDYAEKFLKDAKELYGNKYDYSKTKYIGLRNQVTIICPKHGDFSITPENHIKKHQGCPLCDKKDNANTFIEKSKKVHGDYYDYSKSVYTGANDKIEIICPKHGSFWIRASAHYSQKQGCPKCARDKARKSLSHTTEEFIEKAKEIHGDYYDYSKVKYINLTSPVHIKCPIHGIFSQAPRDHLQGCGCKKCSLIKLGKVVDTESFIKKATKIHGNLYDYSKVEYINNKSSVTIICPIHGEFSQTPESHLKGHGCKECALIKDTKRKTYELYKVLEKCIDVHDNYYKYIYNPSSYQNETSKIEIICPKHGIFKQRANFHLNGGGCPKCNVSKGQIKVRKFLQDNFPKINFVEQYRDSFLERLSYDFYLPELKLAIEYNGAQHYMPVDIFGGEETFKKQLERDKRKLDLSNENGIILFSIKYDKDEEDLVKLKELIMEICREKGINMTDWDATCSNS